MTTDETFRPVWRVAKYCALAGGIWFGGLAAVAWAFEPTRSVIVLAPGKGATIALVAAADVALLEVADTFLTVAGRSPGFVKTLYAAGAWLVLPASGSGCRAPSNRRAGFS